MVSLINRVYWQKRARKFLGLDQQSQQVYVYARDLTGERIHEGNALTVSAVWACVRLISETVGLLSWHLYEQDGDRRRVLADTALDWLIHREPNSEMSSMSFREVLTAQALIYGNGYAEIERDRAGRPLALWPMSADRVQPYREGGALVYRISSPDGKTIEIPSADVFHLHGLGWNGITGYSVVRLARQSMGLGKAAESFGSAFFGNGCNPSISLSHPANLSTEAQKRLSESIQAQHRGTARSNGVLILEEGMKVEQMTIPPEDAQFLETRKFQTSEIARWFRVPPHKIGDLERATHSNIEHQAIEFVTDTILPWATRWEQECDRKILSRNQRGRMYSRLNLDTLLRGDMESRSRAYSVGRQWGWLSADDVRRMEDLDPLPDGQGDLYLVPVNMTTPEGLRKMAESAGSPPEDSSAPEGERSAAAPERSGVGLDRVILGYHSVIGQVAARCVRREVLRLRERRSYQRQEIERFCREHADYVLGELRTVVLALADAVAPGSAAQADKRLNEWVESRREESIDELRRAADARDGAAALLDLWEVEKAKDWSDQLVRLAVQGAEP